MKASKKTGWEIACDWYRLEEIERGLSVANSKRFDSSNPKIPADVFSPEFAAWLTDQYRLAMTKGIQFGREHNRDAIDALAAERDDLAAKVERYEAWLRNRIERKCLTTTAELRELLEPETKQE